MRIPFAVVLILIMGLSISGPLAAQDRSTDAPSPSEKQQEIIEKGPQDNNRELERTSEEGLSDEWDVSFERDGTEMEE